MKIIEYTMTENCVCVDFLKKTGYSSEILTKLRKELGLLKRNNTPIFITAKLAANDILTVTLKEQAKSAILPIKMELNIVYEDDDILIVDKQKNLAVIPTNSHYNNSLLNGLAEKYGCDKVFHIVTRLDKDTSGLMLIAKNSLCHSLLNKNLKENITRNYMAEVEGHLEGSGIIDKPILAEYKTLKRKVDINGQTAITTYQVLYQKENSTIVKINLKTGRTHQIRVHLKYINHPIVGDYIYGSGGDGQHLHSCYLSFTHPFTKQILTFTSEKQF